MFTRAFTLIELLIVIVILGILITIVLSVATRPMTNVYAVKCQDNLRRLYTACVNYATEERSFPWAGDGAAFWEHWALLVRWCDNGKDISPKNFVCPEFLNKRPAEKDMESGRWELRGPENVSYAYANEVRSMRSSGYLAADMDVEVEGHGQGHPNFILILTCDGEIIKHKMREGEDWESVCGRWLTRE